MFISDFAIKRPLITVVSMLALAVFGIFALLKLKTDEFPDVAPPFVSVGIVYPGASPDIVEKQVLDPVEEQIQAISGVKQVMGKAYDGYALILVEFLFEKDLNEATQDIRDGISTIRSDLPSFAGAFAGSAGDISHGRVDPSTGVWATSGPRMGRRPEWRQRRMKRVPPAK